MFSVVAIKSRAFSTFSYSADEQVCRSWEGAQPGRQPKLAHGNIPHHGCNTPFMNGGWLGGQKALCSSLGQEFELSFQAANRPSGGEKNSIVYSLLCILIIIIVFI